MRVRSWLTGLRQNIGLVDPRIVVGIAANLVAAVVITTTLTSFGSADEVLARRTWGHGKPSSTSIMAFATGRRWWVRYEPEAIVRVDGGVQHVVRVPRDEVVATGRPVRPMRSIGYYAVIGAVTWARSLFSSDLVFDWAFVVRFQQAMLVAALAAVPFVLFASEGAGRLLAYVTTYNACWLVVLSQWPNDAVYLSEGVIDSALAVPFALLAVLAFAVLFRRLEVPGRRGRALAGAAAVVVGFCPLVRGELFPPIAFVYLFAACVLAVVERRRLLPLAACFALTLSPMLVNGSVNKVVFGHFVPLRMQDGQNLLEPIGQYPNPYGIVWSDAWFARYIAEHGLRYQTFEADAFARARYVELVRENPGLFVENFFRRLSDFSTLFGIPIDVLTLALTLAAAFVAAVRDRRRLALVVPPVLAVGYLLFFAWTNSDPRPVAPVHYLVNVAATLVLTRLVLDAWSVLTQRGVGLEWRGFAWRGRPGPARPTVPVSVREA